VVTSDGAMQFQGGYLAVGHWGGAPIRLHWTLPIGAFVFGQGQVVPGFWLGFFLLVLIHELGHAAVVRRARRRVLSIEVHGLGGLCHWDGGASAIDRARIAWGGVQAQLVALLFAQVGLSLFGPPTTAFTAQMVTAFTTTNIWLILINLIPVPPLDGAEAWKLFPLLWQQSRRRPPRATPPSVERELAALDQSDRAAGAKGWSFDAWLNDRRDRK